MDNFDKDKKDMPSGSEECSEACETVVEQAIRAAAEAEQAEREATAEEDEAIDAEYEVVDAEDIEDTDEDSDSDEEEDDKKKKSFFQKKDKKKDKKDQQIEELNDRLVRQMAEFDNFRKRTEKEKSQMFETGASSVIEKILPTIDDFERGLGTIPEAEKESSFATGMEMIYKKLMTTLEDMGVTAIEAVGQEFDPMYHNAVMQEASEEYDSGVITKELQKGYMYKEKVIRHSMVMVAE